MTRAKRKASPVPDPTGTVRIRKPRILRAVPRWSGSALCGWVVIFYDFRVDESASGSAGRPCASGVRHAETFRGACAFAAGAR